jgi:hypothetical protein
MPDHWRQTTVYWKGCERKWTWPNLKTVLAFLWRIWGIQRKISNRIIRVPVKIWTGPPPPPVYKSIITAKAKLFGSVSLARVGLWWWNSVIQVKIESGMFCKVAPCSLVELYQRFGGTYCLQLRHQRASQEVTTKNSIDFVLCLSRAEIAQSV